MTQEALKLALEALEQTLQTLDDENAKPGGAIADTIWHSEHETLFDYLGSEITAIKEALAQPEQDADSFCDSNCVWTDHHPDCKLAQPEQEQEPVIGKWSLREVYFDEDGEPISHRSPPQRKPLTDDELSDIWYKESLDWLEFARAIEAAHDIKE